MTKMFKAFLLNGRHDGRKIEVLGQPGIISVSPAGDVEALSWTHAQDIGDAIALGNELYRLAGQTDFDRVVYEYVTFHALMRAA
jgi:hypothetical protein